MFAAAAAPPAAWWYREPAGRYWEGLPLSNGRLAAMVYGGVHDELIPLNDETLWSGAPYNPVNPEGRAALPEIRRLLLEGRFVEAQELCNKLLSIPLSVQHYQPIGELRLRFHEKGTVKNYRRELDMDSAVARITYQIGETRYTREVFAGYPDQVLVVRISADKPGRVSLSARLGSIQPSARSAKHSARELAMSGSAQTVTEGRSGKPVIPAKMRWQARLRVAPHGGRVGDCRVPEDEERFSPCVSVTDADAVTVVLAAATNYVNWNDLGADPEKRAVERLAAARTSYPELLARHLRDWQPQFHSATLDLGGHEAAAVDTTTRLARLRAGTPDPLFAAQYFQYGRYLLLAESRPGTLPFNNHNVWLNNMEGRWQGRWTLNVNIQECYWPAENTGLPQTNEALFRFVEALAQSGARTARELYGCRGWVAHHGTDIWMNTAPTDRTGSGIWPTAGPWLLQQLWEHYLFRPDAAYLKRLYPLLRGSSQFYLDYLIEDPKRGWLVTAPSISPENSFFTPSGQKTEVGIAPAMDNQLLRDLFDHTARATAALGVDAELRSRVERARQRLPPDRIGRHGQLQEWLEDFDEPSVTHRHLSQLYAFYPSNQITSRTNPELTRAARVALERRGEKNRGWSGAWKINVLARLGEGDRAESLLRRMLTEISLHPGKEDSDRVPSFEGNQGIQGVTAGIAEMLLQSHDGEIVLLPALPKAWQVGRVTGLRARDGFTIDLEWRNGQLTSTLVKSVLGRRCVLRYGAKTTRFDTRTGGEYVRNGSLN